MSLLFLLLLLLNSFSHTLSLSAEGLAVLSLKSSSATFSNWNESDPDPCRWTGITCTVLFKHFPPSVIGISLSARNLTGLIPPQLGSLPNLRRINLRGNNFFDLIPEQLFNASALRSIFLQDNNLSGPLPSSISNIPRLQNLDLSNNSLSGPVPEALRNCTKLQRLILAGNEFSGEVPEGMWTTMKSLETLDLSENKLSGRIPKEIGEVSSLATKLNLSYNQFIGEIPGSLAKLPITVKLDLSNNNLSGEIPHFDHQGPAGFANNPMLCGFPLANLCDAISTESDDENDRKGLKTIDIVLISVAHFILVASIGIGAVYVCRKKQRDSSKCGCSWKRMPLETRSPASICSCIQANKLDSDAESVKDSIIGSDNIDGGGGELVAIDKEFKFEIDELFQASAYVLGMNVRGIVYKVAIGNGVPVVVRRLGSGDGHGYREFAAEAIAIGRVTKHPNVVRAKAFYWTLEEKLLISDFISNGNLASALHGKSGQPSRSLPWSTRLKIARGTAAGLAYIHDYSSTKLIHQSIKPTNILLDHDLNPYISDFGLDRLIAISGSSSDDAGPASYAITRGALPLTNQPTFLINKSSSYGAPESLSASDKPTQKWDVYSFGVVLLELLTGRNPDLPQTSSEDWVLAKWVRKRLSQGNKFSSIIDPTLLNEVPFQKEAIALFQLALACTDDDPELRPKMKLVSENIERIANGT
ncbi:unnamed protein product [Rhodiola kirilowii]